MINFNVIGIAEAYKTFQELIIPWKRKNAEREANLKNAQLQAEIQRINALTLAERAKIERERAAPELDRAQKELILAQAIKTQSEAQLILSEADKNRAEAAKIREGLKVDRINLATEIVDRYNPNLGGAEKVNMIIKLLPDLERLLSSHVVVVEE